MNRSRLAALSAGAMFLVASVLVPATAFAAGSGTLSVSPSAVSTTTGSTFSVTINSQAGNAMSGASAGLTFDKTKLQIVSVAKGAGWDTANTSWVLPSVATIASANSTGTLPAIAAYFSDGTTSLPANTSEALAVVTFFATATGTPSIDVSKGEMIDGAAATYGSAVSVTASGAAVTITAGASTSNGSTTANVTGAVDSGYVSMTCDTPIVLPLVRNATNTADLKCKIGSNTTWTVTTKDTNPDAVTHGFLVDSAQAIHLSNSLHVLSATKDVDLKASASGQTLATGQNNVSLPLTLSQAVAPSDKAGSYGMQVLFSVTSTF